MFAVNHRGFSLAESVITAAVLAIVTLVAVTVMNNVGTGSRLLTSRTSAVELTNALRLQLSRRASCAGSMVQKPNSFGATSAIAIQLPSNGPIVRTGATLPDLGLDVQALEMRNLAPAGTTDGGNPVFLGDVILATRSRDQSIAPPRDITVARLAMEVQGGGLIACYASDAYKDLTQQMQTLCGRIVSPSGVPSNWNGERCITPDANITSTCGAMGGTWTGTCNIHRTSIVVSRYVPPGAYNDGTGYGVSCPGDSVLTGGACTSVIPPRIPMGGMYLGGGYANYFGCAWQAGYEDVGYNIYAACLR